MLQLKGKTIGVTGGTGFLGKYICEVLEWYGANVVPMSHAQVNLNDYSQTWAMFAKYQFDYVIHAAGINGGIQYNLSYPYGIFSHNTRMALNVIESCITHKVKKLVSIITSCGYPDVPCINENMQEELYLSGTVNDTVACHGYAKRNIVLASKFAHKQEGLKAVCVCPTTLYGPRDSFDIDRTKVMGGIIKRFLQAKKDNTPSVSCWGTGAAIREFMYVRDAAQYVVAALQKYEEVDRPLNIGSGQEISIKDLAIKVAKAVKYDGAILWDQTKPDGQLRKKLNRKRQLEILGDMPLVSLDTGIMSTLEWCIAERIV